MRLWRLCFFFIISSSFCQSAYSQITEDQCPNKDFSAKMGPLRYQGNSNQCFAFVAADLMGYAQGVDKDHQISALDVGVSFMTAKPKDLYEEASTLKSNWELSRDLALRSIPFYEKNRRDLQLLNQGAAGRADQPGSPLLAIAAYNHAGTMCTEEQYPSQAHSMEILRDDYIHNKFNQASGTSLMNTPLPHSPSDQPFVQVCNAVPKSLSGFKPIEQVYDEVITTQIKKDADLHCKNRKPMKPMDYNAASVPVGDDSPLAMTIAKVMKEDDVPVGIAYDMHFLQLGSETPYAKTGHVGSIVGSRWNNGKCEFKLRDSSGGECVLYAPDYRKNCEVGNGYLWLSEKDLNRHATDMYVVKAH